MKTASFLAVLLAATFAAGASAAEQKKPSRVPMPTVKITQGEKCVEPTDVMRREHMQFILHQRDETMHRGIRTSKHSFKECVNCHADTHTGSVLGKEGFCQNCHVYAAVSIDCFSCHTDRAEPKAAGARAADDIRMPGSPPAVTASSATTGPEAGR